MSELPISSPYRSTPDKPVSEEERARVTRRLNDAFTAGALDEDAYGRRLDALYSAQHLGELVPVVEGLPPVATHAQPGIVTGGPDAAAPGELQPTRNPMPLVLAVGSGIALIVVLLIVVLIVLL